MKRKWLLASVFLFIVASFVGCSSKEQKVTYVIVMKSAGNAYNERVVEGFKEIIEANGGECIIAYPQSAMAEDQIIEVQELIDKHVDSISIAANDVNALQSILQEAMEKGIKVSTLDSTTNAKSRMVFVNQADAGDIGEALMEAVWDISGGSGQWAILSTTNQAANQNEWIDAMKVTMSDEKFRNMRFVDIVYGDDDYETSKERIRALLKKHPDLKVICAPTVIGIKAAAEVLAEEKSTVKLTGLGLPSEMAEYIGDEDDAICPYLYLWDPMQLGKLTAYVSMALVNGEITGAVGESFTAGDMGQYTIIECGDGGTQVIMGEPLKFDSENIKVWKELF